MRRLLVLALLAACASAPQKPDAPAAPTAATQPPSAPATVVSDKVDGDVREVTLSNGLRVLLKEVHAAPVATLGVWYRVGSRNEHVGITGSSHLLEHLQFKGTAGFPGKAAVWGGLSRVGASFNATTYYDRTNYYETVPIQALPFAIDLEADRMRRSTFTDADRASEMTVVRNELERGENEPGRVLSQLLWATSIVAHPYHHPVIGWRSDVENVPTSQLRKYYDEYYQPDAAVVVCVGDFDSGEVLARIVDKFGRYPGGHSFPPVYTAEEPQRGERRVVVKKPGEVALVSIGWKLPPASSPDVLPLKILELVLSGSLELSEWGDPLDPGIGNRLYQALIDRQLATSAGFDYTLMVDPSVATLSARVRPGIEHKVVEDALRAEIRRLQDEPITAAELARSKKRARAAFALSQDGTFGQAMALGNFALFGDWRFGRDFAGRVEAITAADVQRVAKQYFPDDGATVGWFVPTKADATPPAAPAPAPKASLESPRAPAPVTDPPRIVPIAGAGGDQPTIHRKVLANGLKVLVQVNPTTPSFALAGSVLAGSVHEQPGEEGLASITAQMLERGTRKRSKYEVSALLEEVGASAGFGGGFENAGVSGLALREDLGLVLDVLAEELTQPAFPEEELAKVKAERIARLKQAEDSTGTKARRALFQGLYPKGHPFYAPDLADAIAATEKVTGATVRRWFDTFWGPDRMILTFVGNVDPQEVFAAVEARLGQWRKVGGPAVDAPAVARRSEAKRVEVFLPAKSSVDVLMGVQGEVRRTDPDFYGAMLANYIVGGSANSRLFSKVRNDLGLTYGVGTSLSASKLAGPWTVSLTVNPRSIDPAIAAVREVLTDWHAKGVGDEELADARTSVAGLFQVGLATNGGLAGVLNTYETLGLGAEFVFEHPKRIAATTKAQVDAAIRRHFAPDALLTVVSGTLPK